MTSPGTSYVRPLAALVALVAAMTVLLVAYIAIPAQAAGGSCSTASGTTTCTFASTGAEDTFVVPDGVGTVRVVATGAPGAVGHDGDTAGRGARVSGDLTVAPGQTLYVNVGGAPTGGGTKNCFGDIACIGGFNGGGTAVGGNGGGGGGASDVRTVSRDQSVSLSYRLIVAGGGGGSGEGVSCQNLGTTLLGGAGGDAGSDGSDVLACDPSKTVPGGKAGGLLAGGAGGTVLIRFSGESGVLGQGGGDGGDGGGGGGGLFGGGGGAEVVLGPNYAPAGGGGGGSNLVPPGGDAVLASGDPAVAISYQADAGEPSLDKQACKKGGYKDLGFRNQGQCIKASREES